MVTSSRETCVEVDIADASVARTAFGDAATRPIGHFGGTYRLSAGGERLLVASADGIGAELKLALTPDGEANAWVGADLVNHGVTDILALGAAALLPRLQDDGRARSGGAETADGRHGGCLPRAC